jgi:hypothetical protein
MTSFPLLAGFLSSKASDFIDAAGTVSRNSYPSIGNFVVQYRVSSGETFPLLPIGTIFTDVQMSPQFCFLWISKIASYMVPRVFIPSGNRDRLGVSSAVSFVERPRTELSKAVVGKR